MCFTVCLCIIEMKIFLAQIYCLFLFGFKNFLGSIFPGADLFVCSFCYEKV